MHRRVSACLESVSLYDCIPYRLVPPTTVTCLTFRDLPRSGLNFLINNQTDKNHWKR